MKPWTPTVTALDQLEEGKIYFVRKHCGEAILYWSRLLDGAQRWSVKPGIALRLPGDRFTRQAVEELLTRRPEDRIDCVEVPPDADKRWRARKPVRSR